jgi:hypothetical protein
MSITCTPTRLSPSRRHRAVPRSPRNSSAGRWITCRGCGPASNWAWQCRRFAGGIQRPRPS